MEEVKTMSSQKDLLVVASSPHVHSPDNVPHAMRDVLIALCPALIAALYFFCLPALTVIIACVASAYASEIVCLKVMKKPTTGEYSAVVTGLLLAFCVPPSLPVWMAVLGSVFSVVIAKHLFGGLGQNIFNPALIGWQSWRHRRRPRCSQPFGYAGAFVRHRWSRIDRISDNWCPRRLHLREVWR
jgi:electron transport complex protein RnfD